MCGGVNVFADSPVVAPQVSLESVLAARPDAVLAGVSRQEDKANNLAAWRKLGLPAAQAGRVRHRRRCPVPSRPRLIDAAEALCETLDAMRQ